MKKHIIAVIAGVLFAIPSFANATINIFACEPEWAALASEIGGEHVEVFSATTAQQDPHHIRARPSLIAAIRKAELLICSGGGLEEGWLPILLKRAGSNLQQGGNGSLMAVDYVPILEKPQVLDRSLGHLHAAGNPHVHLNPHNLLLVASELYKRLKILDAENSVSYQSNFIAFRNQWTSAITEWENQAASLRGKQVVVHHKSFTYLLDWLGLKEAATLEPVPGIPPTTSHLENLLIQLKSTPATAIIRTPYDADDASEWLSQKIAIAPIQLPYTVGGDENSQTLYQLFEQSITLLKEATHDR